MDLYKLRIVFSNSNIDLECDLETVKTIKKSLTDQEFIGVGRYLIDCRKISYMRLLNVDGDSVEFKNIWNKCLKMYKFIGAWAGVIIW